MRKISNRPSGGDDGSPKPFWQTILVLAVAQCIQDLPYTDNLYLFAKYTGLGYMRNLDGDNDYRYARYMEGAYNYLNIFKTPEEVEAYLEYIPPITYSLIKTYPNLAPKNFSLLFRDFFRFLDGNPELIATYKSEGSEDYIAPLCKAYIARLQKDSE